MSLDWSRWPNFSEGELRCKCGCGRADMDPAFMDWLQEGRTLFDAPLIVSSGYRCPNHNARVSSTGRNGPHTTGRAVDIRIAGSDAHDLLMLAMAREARGVGVQQKGPWSGRFLHLDLIDGPNRPALWSY